MRAFHLDLKQWQFRPSYLAQWFARLRHAGYDSVVFEIENKVRLDSIGAAAWCEAYDKSQFADILTSCRAAGLDAIPLVQTFGHLEWLLTHAPFHALREQEPIAYLLCPLKEQSRQFLLRYVDEVGELFGHPRFIHLGGDETTYMGTCPACEAKVKAGGKGALYADHLNWIAAHAARRGWRPMLWADMVLAHPDCLERFPKDIVWVDWHYAMTPQGPTSTYLWGEKIRPASPAQVSEAFCQRFGDYAFEHGRQRFRPWFYADFLRDRGHDVLVAPAAASAGCHVFLPSLDRAANVASAELKVQSTPGLLGSLVTSWACRLVPLEAQWPLIALPAAMRSQPGAPWLDALRLVCRQSFGSDIANIEDHWRALGQAFLLAESHLGLDWESGYAGQIPSIPLLLAGRIANQKLEPGAEIAHVEALLRQYTQAARAMEPALAAGESLHPSARFWRLGAEAIQTRAQEYLIYLRAQQGAIESAHATVILRRTQIIADAWRKAMLESCAPASVELAHAIIFGETKRALPLAAQNRLQPCQMT